MRGTTWFLSRGAEPAIRFEERFVGTHQLVMRSFSQAEAVQERYGLPTVRRRAASLPPVRKPPQKAHMHKPAALHASRLSEDAMQPAVFSVGLQRALDASGDVAIDQERFETELQRLLRHG